MIAAGPEGIMVTVAVFAESSTMSHAPTHGRSLVLSRRHYHWCYASPYNLQYFGGTAYRHSQLENMTAGKGLFHVFRESLSYTRDDGCSRLRSKAALTVGSCADVSTSSLGL